MAEDYDENTGIGIRYGEAEGVNPPRPAVGPTPGPWVLDGNWIGTESPDGVGIHDSIAALHAMDPVLGDDGGFEDFDFGPITEANGRLMAAAPNLLSSCKELRDALACAMRVVVEYGASDLNDRIMLEMVAAGIFPGVGVRADAAIAKASGN